MARVETDGLFIAKSRKQFVIPPTNLIRCKYQAGKLRFHRSARLQLMLLIASEERDFPLAFRAAGTHNWTNQRQNVRSCAARLSDERVRKNYRRDNRRRGPPRPRQREIGRSSDSSSGMHL
ncbi:hypothetical protein NKI72_19710 [Mesorhizobium sp. M0437]|uniref:hypothetical protein n=1 Tax=Mesorhizobium sp. M0437 TaxID=2956945 RepID=UPI00333829BC